MPRRRTAQLVRQRWATPPRTPARKVSPSWDITFGWTASCRAMAKASTCGRPNPCSMNGGGAALESGARAAIGSGAREETREEAREEKSTGGTQRRRLARRVGARCPPRRRRRRRGSPRARLRLARRTPRRARTKRERKKRALPPSHAPPTATRRTNLRGPEDVLRLCQDDKWGDTALLATTPQVNGCGWGSRRPIGLCFSPPCLDRGGSGATPHRSCPTSTLVSTDLSNTPPIQTYNRPSSSYLGVRRARSSSGEHSM